MKLSIGDYQIRSWEWQDRVALVRHANNPRVWINLRDSFPYPYTDGDAKNWIRFAREQRPETHFAIANPEEAIGGIGLVLQSDVNRLSAEIGYWLGEPFWGRGIASRAVQALSEYAFANFDLLRIYAWVFEWNPASARVLEKAGYRREGRLRQSVIKNGRVIDQFLYAILREEAG